jgi:antigen flippase
MPTSQASATAPASPLGELPAPKEAVHGKQTYGQILKSSAMIGASSVLNIGIGIVRTKAMAVLLGPAGTGLMGLYSTIVNLAQSVSGMGINSSGVRQIAVAAGSGGMERVAETATVLRRTASLLGIIGSVLLIVFSIPISVLSFGTREHAGAIALLSVAVFFGSVAGGQTALIQGLRRISDLAMMGVLGSLFGTFVSIPVVYFFHEKGIVPALIIIAGMSVLTSWWYSRRTQIRSVAMSNQLVLQEATALLKLGFAFMASGLLMMGAAYAIRIIVVRKLGLEAAGLYQCAWALGGLYVGFILQSMGADFYPRLTAVSNDNAACNRLVNEQALVSLALAGPGVVATMTFAPLVIALFYSAKFMAAVGVLRWFCLGLTMQVVAWPMGFIVLAKNAQKIFLWTEAAAVSVQLGLAWIFIHYFGLVGAGMSFFGLYVWHSLLIFWVVRRLTGFRWSAENRRLHLVFLPMIGIAFGAISLLPFWIGTIIGSLAALCSGIYSLKMIVRLVPIERVPRPLRRILTWLRLIPVSVPQ